MADDDKDTGKTFSEDYVRNLRSEAAGYRTQVRERDALIATLTSERDAARTSLAEAQKVTGDADSRVSAAEARALRAEVAMEKGLSAAQAKRLVGNTKEELLADADEISKTFGGAQGQQQTLNLDQGRTPPPPAKPDVNGALRALAGVTAR